jgi:hypothetical protein
MVEHLRGAIGVHEAGEVSKDGLFSYEEVECMGACEYAPMCRIDHRYHYDLTPAKLDALISERRGGQMGHFPARGEGGAPAPDGEVESPRAPKKPRSPSPALVQATPPLPPPTAATSPASGEVVKPKRQRKKKADG